MEYLRKQTEERKAKEIEIFNTMPHETYDEVVALAEEIDLFRRKCNVYDEMIFQCDHKIKCYRGKIVECNERLNKLNEFKNSSIGKLIKKFLNGENVLYAIKREIKSENPFEIVVDADEWCYETPQIVFSVRSTHTVYHSAFDVDDDMENVKKEVSYYTEKLNKYLKRKETIKSEGIDTKWKYGRDDFYREQWFYDNKEVF